MSFAKKDDSAINMAMNIAACPIHWRGFFIDFFKWKFITIRYLYIIVERHIRNVIQARQFQTEDIILIVYKYRTLMNYSASEPRTIDQCLNISHTFIGVKSQPKRSLYPAFAQFIFRVAHFFRNVIVK